MPEKWELWLPKCDALILACKRLCVESGKESKWSHFLEEQISKNIARKTVRATWNRINLHEYETNLLCGKRRKWWTKYQNSNWAYRLSRTWISLGWGHWHWTKSTDGFGASKPKVRNILLKSLIKKKRSTITRWPKKKAAGHQYRWDTNTSRISLTKI
jgi:hypothetical protein